MFRTGKTRMNELAYAEESMMTSIQCRKVTDGQNCYINIAHQLTLISIGYADAR